MVRVLEHHLRDQTVKRGDAGVRLAAAEQLDAVGIESGQVGPRPAALVLVPDPARLGAQGAMCPCARLELERIGTRPASLRRFPGMNWSRNAKRGAMTASAFGTRPSSIPRRVGHVDCLSA